MKETTDVAEIAVKRTIVLALM